MMGKSKLRRVLVVLFFMLKLRAASAQEMSLRAVYNALSGVMAPIWVAQDAGLFTKHGVNVDLKYLAATTAVQGMLCGGEEIGLVGNQGIDAKLEGADLIYVASGLPVFSHSRWRKRRRTRRSAIPRDSRWHRFSKDG